MINRDVLKLSVIAFTAITLIGCGSSGGSSVENESTTNDTIATVDTADGYYIDSAVEGLTCVSGETSTVTDSEGKFTYEVGKDTICSIGAYLKSFQL